MTVQHSEPVSDQGRALAESTAGEARSVGETVKEQAGRVGNEARMQGRDLLSSATSGVEQEAEEQMHRLAGVLRGASERAQALADGRPDDAGDMDRYVRDLGGTLGDIAGRIDKLGARGTVEELRAFARRRPGAFLAGAAAAGFLASRFLRNAGEGAAAASPQDRREGPAGVTDRPEAPERQVAPAGVTDRPEAPERAPAPTGAPHRPEGL